MASECLQTCSLLYPRLHLVKDQRSSGETSSLCSDCPPEKESTSELTAEEGNLLRCGQNLPVQPGAQYHHSSHCEQPTQNLHLQESPHRDARSAGFQTDLSSSSLSGGVNGCHALPSYPIKQEGYKLGSSLADFSGGMGAGRRELDRPSSGGGGGGEGNLATVLSLSAMAVTVYPFNNEDGSSPLALSPSSRHSARPNASGLKRRCLSVASQSASEGIDIAANICSSQMSCANGLRTNSSSPTAATFSHKPLPTPSPQLPSPSTSSCLLPLSSSSSSSSVSSVEHCEDVGSMQPGPGVGSSDGLGLLIQPGAVLDGCAATLKQEPVDEFSPSEEELFQHHYHHLTSRGSHCGGHSHHHHHHHHHQTGPPRPPMPPPYHLHQYMGSGPGALLHLQSQQQSPPSGLLAQPKPTGLVEQQVGDREDVFSDKQVCRWIDCSAAYEQQEELVRHIEKVHIDQRKGEDFTCFWAGCVRRYKPFNARYKLLIHMRVHSGEKPNKCMVSLHSF
ncbi:Zinc finger protein GLIS1 [Labeo rohita]|uniref:Zinc finger protein GLIS1 n=1 Tax=Labeo rohita TaxID=84645 RepID=A0ABQ8MHL0_LABRO|nr:Zinc finger protein GLIS1 [Labeo rohita]